jgi:hypothetical protein
VVSEPDAEDKYRIGRGLTVAQRCWWRAATAWYGVAHQRGLHEQRVGWIRSDSGRDDGDADAMARFKVMAFGHDMFYF